MSGWQVVRRRFPLVILQGRLLVGAILVAASPVILWPFVILRGPPSVAAWREVQGGLLGRILSDDSYLVHPRVLLERRRLSLSLTELMMLWTQGTVGP